jgi:hypothetical protein
LNIAVGEYSGMIQEARTGEATVRSDGRGERERDLMPNQILSLHCVIPPCLLVLLCSIWCRTPSSGSLGEALQSLPRLVVKALFSQLEILLSCPQGTPLQSVKEGWSRVVLLLAITHLTNNNN